MIQLCPGMNYLFFNLSIPIHHILNLGYLSCVLDGENQSEQEKRVLPPTQTVMNLIGGALKKKPMLGPSKAPKKVRSKEM